MSPDHDLSVASGPSLTSRASGSSSATPMADPPVADHAARYRAILASATDFAIIATDRAGLITDWNTGAERVFGWSEQEMLGTSVERIFTPEDRADGGPHQEMMQSLQHGNAPDERWHMRQDGRRFWGNGEMMPLRDPDGVHIGFLKILRDRTAQRLALDRQHSDAEFLNRVLAASPDCIKVLDLDARLLFMSDAGQRVMEVGDVGAIIGCPWPSFWQGAGNAAANAALAAARQGGAGHFEGMANTMAGNPRWWDVQVTPILDADGRPEKLLVVSRDITERKQADADIGNLVGLVEQSTDFIGIASPEGRMLFVNPAGRNLVGLDDDTPLAELGMLDVVLPDDQAAVAELVLPTVQERHHWEGELRFRQARTGEAIPVLCTIFPLRDVQGTLTGYGTVTRDLRETRRADARRAALLELGDRMRELEDPARMAFVAAEIMGRALGVDRAGYGTLDPHGHAVVIERDWTAPGTASVAGTHLLRHYGRYFEDLGRGETVAIDAIALDPRTADTQAALLALGIQALVNLPLIEQGRLVALFYINHATPRAWTGDELGFVRDVAERTRAAIERRRAEQRLRDLATMLEHQVAERTRERDRIWRVSQDLLGVADSQGRWASINPAWNALLGWDDADIIGRSSEWLEHPDDHVATRTEVSRLAAGHRTFAFENRFRGRDGQYRWLSWAAAQEDGLLYCVARDITAEKAAAEALRLTEDRLHQSQKMEAVGQLTGGLAHDFNNLLTGITGSLELLETRIAQGRLGDVGRYIAAAQSGATRAAALTHRLLAFSRRQTLDPKPTSLHRLVAGMEELIRRTVGPAIEIVVVAGAELWTARVDPNQLENALLNLCINARDAMPDGGRITIETANTSVDEATARQRDMAPGAYLSMAVADTGTGMTPDVIARAFDPFFTTKPLGAGTGLGLSMIYGFARQSGGQVCIHSEPGRGTTMCLYLPRHVEPGDDAAPEAATGRAGTAHDDDTTAGVGRAGRGETVLVVDDEAAIRMLVVETLEELGYTAIEAADGSAGLRVLRSDARIDLLVTDVGLPGGINGRQLADAGRAIRAGLKVLFITGYAEAAVVGDGLLDPGMHVLTKPFLMDTLAGRIEQLITGAVI